jgi:hypothetical protein
LEYCIEEHYAYSGGRSREISVRGEPCSHCGTVYCYDDMRDHRDRVKWEELVPYGVECPACLDAASLWTGGGYYLVNDLRARLISPIPRRNVWTYDRAALDPTIARLRKKGHAIFLLQDAYGGQVLPLCELGAEASRRDKREEEKNGKPLRPQFWINLTGPKHIWG